MTDAEIIRKLTEKTVMLEDLIKEYISEINEQKTINHELTVAKYNSEIRETDFARKLKAIEDEVNQYQFDSVTNLQNKIKTILMSENSKGKH